MQKFAVPTDEEMKRLKQATSEYTYNQVGFQYGEDAAPQIGPNPQDPDEAAAKQAFILPRNFDVPAHIQLPETMKQHAIIERTARFIASEGIQMEILLKAKQSNNAQFEFLTQNSLLNPYYKFVLEAFKNGTYPVESTKAASETENDKTTTEADDAIAANDKSNKTLVVPTIKFTPSENCAYTQLISKIRGVPLETVISEAAKESTPDPAETKEKVLPSAGTTTQVEVLKNTSALALAQNYCSDTESEEEAEAKEPEIQLNFPVPMDNLKSIIDKTATYVIKNGRKFEETLRSRDTERFKFLLPENEYYAYYLYKVTGDPDAASKEEKTRRAAAVAAALLSRKGLNREKNNSPTPVSFTIKAKEEAAVNILPVALAQDASDEEYENKKEDIVTPRAPSIGPINSHLVSREVADHVQKAVQMIESQLMARNAQTASTPLVYAGQREKSTLATTTTTPISRQQMNLNLEQEQRVQYEQQQQNRQKELKRVEEKVKDKLAQIAREKLCGLISKEKQLQQERKRKAIVFLNQIKSSPPAETSTPPSQSAENDTFPITFYGPADDDGEDVPQSSNIAHLPEIENSVVTVLSDDDDVMLVSETRPDQMRHKYRRRSLSNSSSYTHKSKRCEKSARESEKRRHKHKSSHSSSKKKKKSRKHDSRSRSRSGSRHRRSSSCNSSRSKSKKHKSRH